MLFICIHEHHIIIFYMVYDKMRYHYVTRLIWMDEKHLQPFYEVSVQRPKSTKLKKIGLFPAEISFTYRGKAYSTILMLQLMSNMNPHLTNALTFPKDPSEWFQNKKLNKSEFIRCTKQIIDVQIIKH